MKIIQINTVCKRGSVGNIAADLYEMAESHGWEAGFAFGRGSAPDSMHTFKTGSLWDMGCHVLRNFFKGEGGFGSKNSTKALVKWLEEEKPDVLHLHNLHGFYLDVEILFAYIKREQIQRNHMKVIWTLHDCWSFTGHCAFYDYSGCDKWKTQCGSCQYHRKVYPYALFCDNTRTSYERKKEAFSGVPKMSLVVPSRWLAEQMKESFLKDYPVHIIPNGIPLDVFRILPEKKGMDKKSPAKIILGVANVWEKRKGMYYFLMLAEQIMKEKRNDLQILLVGVNSSQRKSLGQKYPQEILRMRGRTSSRKELVELYNQASVFVNPTLEDNFPTTNLEALACGLPVVTFQTGGSPEALDASCGIVVPKGDFQSLYQAVVEVLDRRARNNAEDFPYSKEACRKKAEWFGKDKCFEEYLSLYQE